MSRRVSSSAWVEARRFTFPLQVSSGCGGLFTRPTTKASFSRLRSNTPGLRCGCLSSNRSLPLPMHASPSCSRCWNREL